MNGRRVPDGTEPHEYEPGDYGRWRDMWFCRAPLPDGAPEEMRMTGNLSRHDVVEHEDGTITVSPSILMEQGRHRYAGQPSPEWHGYLERGVWRTV